MWKYRYPHGGISRPLWIKSSFFEMCPECIHVSHIEDHPSPASHGTILFQIEVSKLCVRYAKRRENMHPSHRIRGPYSHISVETHGNSHVCDLQRDARNSTKSESPSSCKIRDRSPGFCSVTLSQKLDSMHC